MKSFPKKFKSHEQYLRALYKRKAFDKPVLTHINSEGGGFIHEAMYAMEKQGLVEIIRRDHPVNDTAFYVRLTIQGKDRVTLKRQTRLIILIGILSILTTIIMSIFF